MVKEFQRKAELQKESPKKLPLVLGDLGPHITHGFLGSTESILQTVLDQFSHFCRAHSCERQTDRQTMLHL